MSTHFDYRQLQELLEGPHQVALCTVVQTKGSTPQKVGAKMAVVQDGTPSGGILGTIGGGAIEHQIRDKALEVLANGESQLVETALSTELGMCCGGQMSVFIEPLASKPNLMIFGAGHIGQALARQGVALNFKVFVADPREDLLQAGNFSPEVERIADYTSYDLSRLPFTDQTYVVVVTHDHQIDQQLVEMVLRKPFRYAALVGSLRKARLTVQRCLNKGYRPEEITKLLCPAGLNISAQPPEEIAISIMGQITQCRHHAETSPFWEQSQTEIQKALSHNDKESVA